VVGPEQRAGPVAAMLTGLALATIGGVPLFPPRSPPPAVAR